MADVITLPVSGALSQKPPMPNTWGGDKSPVFFHPDGPIGCALRQMRDQARMDIDGDLLADLLGRAATDVVLLQATPQQGLDRYKAIRDRLPAGSDALILLDEAIDSIDAHGSPVPQVPACTPEPLRKLMADLHAIPLVRRDPQGETFKLDAILAEFAGGRLSGWRFVNAVDQQLGNQRHERFSDSGKMWIDRLVYAAVAALRADRSLQFRVEA